MGPTAEVTEPITTPAADLRDRHRPVSPPAPYHDAYPLDMLFLGTSSPEFTDGGVVKYYRASVAAAALSSSSCSQPPRSGGLLVQGAASFRGPPRSGGRLSQDRLLRDDGESFHVSEKFRRKKRSPTPPSKVMNDKKPVAKELTPGLKTPSVGGGVDVQVTQP
ncbi:unnamed protein product [Pleuronectes platessa]|uniref:Uncharacterized protein n=1 Tax=Pleuronectes platessa TaxID=8262 RepID=A0A9N7Z6V4_PLEPL|nr:unnamed protein product [Pleuronectes platessa]